MKGDLLTAWPYVWSDVWVRLYETKGTPVELFSELYAALIPKPRRPVAPPEPVLFDVDGNMIDPAEIAAADDYKTAMTVYDEHRLSYEKALTANPEDARAWLRDALHTTLQSEAAAILALETAFLCIEDIGGDLISNRYVNLVEAFIEKYNLRYDLRRPFSFHPNLPGIFASLVNEVKELCLSDANLENSLQEYDDALRDLKLGATPGRLKNCFIKQFNTLEAITARNPTVTAQVLSDMCAQVQSWPHVTVKQAAQKIYAFRGAYPNMGHGTGGGALREIEMRDLVSVSIMLVGLLPYLSNEINPNVIFGGKA